MQYFGQGTYDRSSPPGASTGSAYVVDRQPTHRLLRRSRPSRTLAGLRAGTRLLRFEYEQLEDLSQEAYILPGKPVRRADYASTAQG
jgi:hypothetical protein